VTKRGGWQSFLNIFTSKRDIINLWELFTRFFLLCTIFKYCFDFFMVSFENFCGFSFCQTLKLLIELTQIASSRDNGEKTLLCKARLMGRSLLGNRLLLSPLGLCGNTGDETVTGGDITEKVDDHDDVIEAGLQEEERRPLGKLALLQVLVGARHLDGEVGPCNSSLASFCEERLVGAFDRLAAQRLPGVSLLDQLSGFVALGLLGGQGVQS